MSSCINLIYLWCEREPGAPCEYCELTECECEPGEGANFSDIEFCGQPGKPILTQDGIKYVCNDCCPSVIEEGHLNGFELPGHEPLMHAIHRIRPSGSVRTYCGKEWRAVNVAGLDQLGEPLMEGVNCAQCLSHLHNDSASGQASE
jgi:hypothetical protein